MSATTYGISFAIGPAQPRHRGFNCQSHADNPNALMNLAMIASRIGPTTLSDRQGAIATMGGVLAGETELFS